ncbi:unnamed protein product [Pleuronectes platessa]|uniref:Uncharacterized protein n=1 Tax=Pleuronectes platessa TaxID=8262 RepID=A0A9N7U6G9_PLEPL|nr:unnamed protein product [Pleuronectes platessa]
MKALRFLPFWTVQCDRQIRGQRCQDTLPLLQTADVSVFSVKDDKTILQLLILFTPSIPPVTALRIKPERWTPSRNSHHAPIPRGGRWIIVTSSIPGLFRFRHTLPPDMVHPLPYGISAQGSQRALGSLFPAMEIM